MPANNTKLDGSKVGQVRMLLEEHISRKVVSEKLGVHITTLYGFLRKYLPDVVGVRGVLGRDEDLVDGDVWAIGYENLYAVNANGEVISYRNNSRKVLKGGVIYDKTRNIETYKIVCLTDKEGKPVSEYVHRLVAKALLPNPENLLCVNHKNLDKLDNSLENLEWATFSENTKHGYEEGAWDESIKLRKEQSKKKALGLIDSSLFKVDVGTYKELLEEKDFIDNRVPPEMVSFSITRGDYKSQWKFFFTLLRDCDDKSKSLSFVAKKHGIDQSYVSYIRNGLKMKKARKVYEKYKDNPYYTDYIQSS